MDEYSILRKKQKKNAFVATSLLISIAIALIALVAGVLILGKVDNKNFDATDDGTNLNLGSGSDVTCVGLTKEMIFNDNLRNIKEAAISYFTNERLPKNVGDTAKITLKEMKEKKIILNVIDSTSKSCLDDKSYVEVTKEDNEYVMKIFLSCNDLEDYILVHLGCYDYCDKDVCEKKQETPKTYEYEYKKTTSCTMSPWSDWSSWKTTREKTSNLKKEDTKVETSTKTVTDTKDATKSTTYNCNNYPGYTLVGTKCVKTSTITDTKDATKNPDTYNCDSYPGYTLSGTKCVKSYTNTDTKDATKNPDTYNCNSYPGYTLSGTKCVKSYTNTDTKDATKNPDTYNCNSYSGYTLSGTKCVKTTKLTENAEAVYSTRQKTEKYTCYKQQCTTKTVFTCPQGQSCGNYPQTSCEKVKQTCTKKVDEQYISSYECKDNTYTLSQDKDGNYFCTKTVTDTKDATKNPSTYNCNSYSGYTLNGTKCVKTVSGTDTKDATKNPSTYNCNDYSGYTLNGTKCVKTVSGTYIKDATKNPSTYNCDNYKGYTLSGTKCVKTSKVDEAKNATVVVTYSCPNGYTKNNTTCTKTGTETIKTTYYRYATRTCNGGSTSIKWSTSQNDSILKGEGYKLTGNKKEIIVK